MTEQSKVDIATIPLQELISDRFESLVDLAASQEAICLGEVQYIERAMTNREIIDKIDEELKRREITAREMKYYSWDFLLQKMMTLEYAIRVYENDQTQRLLFSDPTDAQIYNLRQRTLFVREQVLSEQQEVANAQKLSR